MTAFNNLKNTSAKFLPHPSFKFKPVSKCCNIQSGYYSVFGQFGYYINCARCGKVEFVETTEIHKAYTSQAHKWQRENE